MEMKSRRERSPLRSAWWVLSARPHCFTCRVWWEIKQKTSATQLHRRWASISNSTTISITNICIGEVRATNTEKKSKKKTHKMLINFVNWNKLMDTKSVMNIRITSLQTIEIENTSQLACTKSIPRFYSQLNSKTKTEITEIPDIPKLTNTRLFLKSTTFRQMTHPQYTYITQRRYLKNTDTITTMWRHLPCLLGHRRRRGFDRTRWIQIHKGCSTEQSGDLDRQNLQLDLLVATSWLADLVQSISGVMSVIINVR